MKKQVLIIGIIGVFFLFQPIIAQTWTAAKRLTWNSGNSRHPAIATDSNNHIHVVWYDGTPGNEEIFYKRCTDGGATWTAKRLTYNSGYSYHPSIAIDSNNHIHVVWYDGTPGNAEIYYKRSTDGGATWITKRLTYNHGHSYHPSIAVDSNNHIHVIWFDVTPGNAEIYYKRSTDGGATWTAKRLTYNSGNSHDPSIAIDSNNHIHVVWWDYTPSNWEIYYKRSTDGGATWTTKRLTYNSGESSNPALATDSNNHIHVVWYEPTPGLWEIYYKRSTDGGATWRTKQLTYNSGFSSEPAIGVDSNNHIHVVWFDGTPGNAEIYYKRSTDGGATWAEKRLTYNSGFSSFPALATDSNNHIHVVWWDSSPGNEEIYYRKGIQ